MTNDRLRRAMRLAYARDELVAHTRDIEEKIAALVPETLLAEMLKHGQITATEYHGLLIAGGWHPVDAHDQAWLHANCSDGQCVIMDIDESAKVDDRPARGHRPRIARRHLRQPTLRDNFLPYDRGE